jgi:hypothetical protein
VCNLYVRHFNGGVWEKAQLVAVLPPGDSSDWAGEHLDKLTAQVAPSGGWMAFTSQRALTGYDNRDVSSGRPDEEVYLYHAGPGTLVCASCNPTGARPAGVEFVNISPPTGIVGASSSWSSSTWVAASVPGWSGYRVGSALNPPRLLSDTGRLFFDSSDALVPQDVNGTEDVYEYEPQGYENAEGKHQCMTETVTFSARSGGCVGLISSGASTEESALLDASESGGDVFFLTASKLAPQDYDTNLDVYDAHECTASSPCVAPGAAVAPPCGTEASCKASPTPQPGIFGAPSSATFSGVGNVAPPPTPPKDTKKTVKCKKGFVKNKKGKCVKRPKKKAKHAKRAGNNRRGK